MKGYVKIYGSILGSSVWSESPATRIVWITLLALADENGHVEASVSGLARFANVSVGETNKALDTLSAPDADSKSPEYEGRRIERAERGWTILNYLAYREMRSPKQVLEAQRKAAWRARHANGTNGHEDSDDARDMSQMSPDIRATVDVAEAVAATEAVKKKEESGNGAAAYDPAAHEAIGPQYESVATQLPSDEDRRCLRAILARCPVPQTFLAEIDASLQRMAGHVWVTPTQAGQALREFVADGKASGAEPPKLRQLRRYFEVSAMPQGERRPQGSPSALGSADRPDWQMTDRERWERAAARLEAEEKANAKNGGHNA